MAIVCFEVVSSNVSSCYFEIRLFFLIELVADQLDGDQNRHSSYRKQICEYMTKNREDFEPFIVDQSFDAFIKSLSKDGTYGGNESIVACSRLFDARICIHQVRMIYEKKTQRFSSSRMFS